MEKGLAKRTGLTVTLSQRIKESKPNDIKQILFYICKLLGIRDESMPEDSELKILISWIERKLNNFTLHDYIEAFELLLDQKLDNRTEHFGKISPQYLTDVMISYRKYQRLTEPEAEPEPKIPTEKERQQIVLNTVLVAFEAFKKSNQVIDIKNKMYDFLKTLGLLPFTEDERTEILGQAEEVYKNVLTQKSQAPEFKDISFVVNNLNDASNINSIAKDIALHMYFQQVIEFELDLETLINDKLK